MHKFAIVEAASFRFANKLAIRSWWFQQTQSYSSQNHRGVPLRGPEEDPEAPQLAPSAVAAGRRGAPWSPRKSGGESGVNACSAVARGESW